MKGITGLAVFVLLAGCNADRQSGSRLDEGNKPQWLSETVEPRNLRLSLDTATAQEKIIQVSGGTLEATGPDGSIFVLEIPTGALLAPTHIRMTPVTRAEGFPGSGRMVATVQLEPEGLQLYRPASLTIQPSTAVSESETFGYAYAGSGSDAHLYPVQGDSSNVQFRLSHFSGYGILYIKGDDMVARGVLQGAADERKRLASAFARSVREMRCRAAIDGEAFGESEATLKQLRRDCGNLSDPRKAEELKEIQLSMFLEFYEVSVLPIVHLALQKPEAFHCALQALLSFQRQIAIFYEMDETVEGEGLDRALSHDIASSNSKLRQLADGIRTRLQQQATLQDRLQNVYLKGVLERLRERCREGDLSVAADAMLLMRSSALQGVAGYTEKEKVVALDSAKEKVVALDSAALDLLSGCYRFELDFVSQITNSFQAQKFSYHVKAKDLIEPLKGDSAKLEFVSFILDWNPAFGPVKSEVSAEDTRNGVLTIDKVQPVMKLRPKRTVALDCQGEGKVIPIPETDSLQIQLRIRGATEVTRIRNDFDRRGTLTRTQNWQSHYHHFRREHWFDPEGELENAGMAPAEGVTLHLYLKQQGTSGEWRTTFEKVENTGSSSLKLFEKGHLVLRHRPRLEQTKETS